MRHSSTLLPLQTSTSIDRFLEITFFCIEGVECLFEHTRKVRRRRHHPTGTLSSQRLNTRCNTKILMIFSHINIKALILSYPTKVVRRRKIQTKDTEVTDNFGPFRGYATASPCLLSSPKCINGTSSYNINPQHPSQPPSRPRTTNSRLSFFGPNGRLFRSRSRRVYRPSNSCQRLYSSTVAGDEIPGQPARAY